MAESSVPGAVGERPDTTEVLRSFVAWASEWLDEKRRREDYRITPGTIPPASFAERPAELNGQLAALMEEGVAVLAAGGAVGEREEPRAALERLLRFTHALMAADHEAPLRAGADLDDLYFAERVARLSVNEGGVARTEADEEAAIRWLEANDLYAVTHIHESDDCGECQAASPVARTEAEPHE